MKTTSRSRAFALALAALLAGLAGFAACTTDSPTEPVQTAPPSDGTGDVSSGVWDITIQSSAGQLEADGQSAILTIRVRNAETGALPPDGAVITVAVSLGSLGSAGSGVQSALLELLSGVARVSFFPGSEPGTAIIQAQLEGSVGQTSIRIVEPATPDVFFVERVEPSEGSPDGGEVVRIFGQEFEEPVRVFIGGLPAEVLSVSSTVIRVRTPRIDLPRGEESTVDVEVTINVNEPEEASDTLVSGFTYTRGDVDLVPDIFSVTPNSGPNEGGTRVAINGDGFQTPVQVLFEGGASVEAQVESISRTQIVAISPAATGFGAANRDATVAIRVVNLNSGLSDVLTNAFQYGVQIEVFEIDPIEGPFFGGTRVTIFGKGFDEPLVVDFGSIRQQVLSVTGTEILVRTVGVDPGQSCQDIAAGTARVTNLETGDTASGGSPFTYQVSAFGPDITGTDPETLAQPGGMLRVLGRNFREPLEVSFAGRPVSVLSVDDTEIRVDIPATPNSDLDVEACDDNFDGFEGERFILTPLELQVVDGETSCFDTLQINVRPSNTSCRNDEAPMDDPTPTPEP